MSCSFKFQIEVDVFCANDVEPPAYLIARYLRENMPKLILKGDLDKLSGNNEHEFCDLLLRGKTKEAVEVMTKPSPDWDGYSVHLRHDIKVLNS